MPAEPGESPRPQAHKAAGEPGLEKTKVPQEGLLGQRRRLAGVLGTLRRRAVSFGRELLPIDEKIPLEEIDAQRVARVIYENVRNPLTEDPWRNPFDITTVMANAGYIGLLNTTDYRERFPQEYAEFQKSLRELATQGAIEGRVIQDPNLHNETMFYNVVNPELLQGIAKPSALKPATP
ncbi:hypothetical protein M1307_01090 [Patescibacteria group bacterium]|nr:hypothetical protein [Patescibacteria group bacterium]